MSCEPYLDLISARLDEPLTPEQAEQLNTHIRVCPACRAIARDLENIHSVLADCEVPAPAELSEQVMAQIRRQTRSRRRSLRQLGALAACLVLCVGAYWLTGENLPAVGGHLPLMARTGGEEQPVSGHVADSSTFTNEQHVRLSAMSTSFEPSAVLLDNTEGLSRFIARFPYDDLSTVVQPYDEEYFRTHRLLAVVLCEPSSSISHTITTLNETSVSVQRTVPPAGDCDVALWLIVAEVERAGPEQMLDVELHTN